MRYLLKKSTYQKTGKEQWSENIYRIKTIDGNGYILEDPNTEEELKTKKYVWELQFLKNNEVVKVTKQNNKKEEEDKIINKDKLVKKVKYISNLL